jgi:hypothetical protein
MLAFLIGSSELGLRRIALTIAGIQGTAVPPQPRENGEIVRLSETLKTIATDRDQLLARLETLERNLDDLTGSVARSYTSPRPAEIVPPSPAESTTTPMIVSPNAPSSPSSITALSVPANISSSPPASVPAASNPVFSAPQSPSIPSEQEVLPADTPTAAKIDFGIDLGSATTIEGLRNLWTSATVRHGALLEGMRPIIALRERTKPGNVELRLVAGPLPSAALAARICVVITAAGALCQPAVFDGQRLVLR